MVGILKRLIINIYFWLMFIIVTLLFFAILPLYLLFAIIFKQNKLDSALRSGIVFYGWILVTVIPFLAPVKVESRTEELPLPAIIVANHNSAVDPFLFGALLIEAGFIATWPFKIPVYGLLMRFAQYVNANEGWEKICRKSAAILQSGTSLIIWPEGHRSPDGRLGRFRNGAFFLAVKTGYPILPVCIFGSRKFLPPGKRMMRSSCIKLIVLDPIYPDQQNGEEQEIIKLRKAAHEVIRKTLGEENKQLETVPFLKEAKNAN
jgi:1-acyl-sn-glycerol-3-phosphate acyltransferase